jgi:hypothetical protein
MPTPDDYKRLRRASDASWQRLRIFREERVSAIQQFVGIHYGEGGAAYRVPVNFLELAVSIYRRLLAPRSPRVLWTTPVIGNKMTAETAELAENELLEEIQFGMSLARWVTEALFTIGVMKVGLAPEHKDDIAGLPFADVVSFDDWVVDMGASRIEDAQFIGNRYYMTVDKAREAFDRTDIEQTQTGRLEGDTMQASEVSKGQHGLMEERFHPVVEVWDYWLPIDGKVVTFIEKENEPVHEIDWEGPERGPYHILAYNEVPDNIMPLAPIDNLKDLHDLANRLFRKMSNQAINMKTVTGFAQGGEEDAQRLKDSSDLDMIRMDDPNLLKIFKTGTIDPNVLATFLQLRGLFSYMAGNIDLLGGLGAQSDTLGQDQLLATTASERMRELRDKTISAVGGVVEDIGAYLWNDPSRQRKVLKRIGELELELEFSKKMKKGDLSDYMIRVAPYSLQSRTPAERLRTITNLFQGIITPLAPLMAEQGIVPDMKELVRIIAKYSDTHELADILIGSLRPPEAATSDRGRQSPTTTRHNVRHNIPGASRQGQEDTMSRILTGAGVQKAEADALSRPASATQAPVEAA